jgi:predicted RNase H-like HicB family nuclease
MIKYKDINLNKRNMRQVIIYPGENGYWVAQCPSLPPCISQGETKEEAIANIKEAIELYIELLQEEGRVIPEDQVETVMLAV